MNIKEALEIFKSIIPYRYNVPSEKVEAAKRVILDAAKEGKLGTSFNAFVSEVHENAKSHGWWDEERSFGELIALCHSELSEALEAYRSGHDYTETFYIEGGKPEGIPSELADVIIRILDMCGHYGIDIGAIIAEKHEFNKTRPYKHGGKVI